ncbi:unnamed protein product [Spirodela intermedia]|uniref:Rubicon Homology domain-containing protein n=1 Tax=Spirodela intermedia TaxID=51605 RepID=A0A7I8J665_SPIIN|nr:unnamed protein product [Spirodela intermedia]CAA6665534.1 unnamed protein product [Spirodela intermedia]
MEKASEGVASPDPLGGYCSWLDNKSDDDDDASPASSHFSSCEGSEFERYCSANSVLGTASICSSSGNHGEFLDSFRSIGPGEDNLAEGPSVRDRIWRNQRPADDTFFGKFDGFSDGEGDSSRADPAVEIKFPVEKYETSEFYHEMVLEMEEILLDSGESAGARRSQGDRGDTSQKSYNFRDGGSTASISGTDDFYTGNQYPVTIDCIEVVGAKQKKGDVSFGERLVGVKEYTIYILRVKSGKDQWELKTLFTDHGMTLPSPWNSVVRESRNLFGNASPSVITQRSILIQDCLNSVLHFRFSSGTPSPLIWFLCSNRVSHSSDPLNHLGQNPQKISAGVKSNSSYCGEPSAGDVSKLGKTISLVLEIKRYLCAGCHRRLDAGKTLVQGLAKTFGWEKNRFCEYTGQLFCFICHTNDAAILPARVLHHWDFSLYSVSQLAKAFLDSIYDQPMLCVSAVNPFLLSKVPALHQIMGIRKRIASMLPYVRCPFQRNDFFALRDLADLSRGAFSALPTLVEMVEGKILTHIAQQCLICYDSGTPCAARQTCEDPSSLIFPFQEAEAVRCSSCNLLFHQPCILKMGSCPCGKLVPVDGQLRPASGAGQGADIELKGFVDASAESSDAKALSGFFADLMSKARPENLWKKTRKTHPVILMGPLPGTEG